MPTDILGAVHEIIPCAQYGRFSTYMQRKASIEDQRRSCEEFATGKGWKILEEHLYKDEARSGTTKVGRSGLKALETAAAQRSCQFKCILFDDTSRLGRDQADVLNFVKVMRHYGIRVCFVSQNLDSNDDNFEMLLNLYSLVDAQTITRLRSKVFSAQKGRVLAGFIAGSWPYGYEPVKVASADAANAVGRATIDGTKLRKVEREAEVIRRVYQLFIDGYSMWKIATILNQEKVPSPRNVQAGTQASEWSRDAIKRILHNRKYRGVHVWNVSVQHEHPVTGQIRKEYKPAHEHVTIPLPELRIVSDELWDKAQARLKQLEEKHNSRLLGGWNRAKSQEYLYSGLLFCGICGSRMKIGGKQGRSFYECPNHRYRRGCTNHLRLPERRAAEQITSALSQLLLVPEHLRYLAEAVYREINAYWDTQRQEALRDGVHTLEQERRACEKRIQNLLDDIENNGSNPLVARRLQERQFELQRVEERLSAVKGRKRLDVTMEQLLDMVTSNVKSLFDALSGEVPLARKLLLQYVRRLQLFPGKDEAGRPTFDVLGEVDMYAGPGDPQSGVQLGCSGTQTPQQHTERYILFWLTLRPDQDLICPMLEPLCDLLRARPELSSEPILPSEWARLIYNAMPDGPGKPKRFGYGAFVRSLRIHRELLETRLRIVKTPNPENLGHLYQISLRRADDDVSGDCLPMPFSPAVAAAIPA